MNTVKHLKSSKSSEWRKTPSQYWSKKLFQYIPAVVFGSLVGTYLDLYFVGKKIYSFPVRPLPEVFSINIAFTLLGLPLFIVCFLYIAGKLIGWRRTAFIMLVSLLMSIFEILAEGFGLFIHSTGWRHSYTFLGFGLYLVIVFEMFRWTRNKVAKG